MLRVIGNKNQIIKAKVTQEVEVRWGLIPNLGGQVGDPVKQEHVGILRKNCYKRKKDLENENSSNQDAENIYDGYDSAKG